MWAASVVGVVLFVIWVAAAAVTMTAVAATVLVAVFLSSTSTIVGTGGGTLPAAIAFAAMAAWAAVPEWF